MAVSETARKIVLDLCELCDVSWTESKAIEKIRAFRADGRDSDGAASSCGAREYDVRGLRYGPPVGLYYGTHGGGGPETL